MLIKIINNALQIKLNSYKAYGTVNSQAENIIKIKEK